jgi:hypothetical protein
MVDVYNLEEKFMVSPLIGDNLKRSIFGGAGFLPVSLTLPSLSSKYLPQTHECMTDHFIIERFIYAR